MVEAQGVAEVGDNCVTFSFQSSLYQPQYPDGIPTGHHHVYQGWDHYLPHYLVLGRRFASSAGSVIARMSASSCSQIVCRHFEGDVVIVGCHIFFQFIRADNGV